MECPECGEQMRFIETGVHIDDEGCAIPQGFWRCPECGATC